MAADEEDDSSLDPQKSVNCRVCKVYIQKNAEKVKCKTCTNVIHKKCFDSVCSVFVVFNKNYWQCKSCVIGVSSSSTSSTCKSPDTDILKVNCHLQQQITIQEKLITELENVNQLQREKIAGLEEKQLISVPTFRDVVKNDTISSSADLVIKPLGAKIDSRDILKTLHTRVDPTEHNLKVLSTKPLRNGVLVRCLDDNSRNVVVDNVKNILGANFVVENAKKWSPRLIVRGIDKEFQSYDNERLKEELIERNNLNHFSQDVKIVTKLKSKFCLNLVIEVSGAARRKLLDAGIVFMGWRACKCEDHILIPRCFKCSRLGHISKNCTKTAFCCPKCAGNHELKDCSSESIKCINCWEHNVEKKSSFSFDHRCSNVDKCSVYKKLLSLKKSKIDYGQ